MTNIFEKFKIRLMKYRYRFIIYLILLIITLLVAYLIFYPKTAEMGFYSHIMMSECMIQQVNIPYYVEVYTLGTLTEERTEKMDKIMNAESNDNSIAKNPTSSAYGRCQFLKSTRDYVEKKWDIKINWNDPEQQGYACERLLREEGDSHWKESKEVWSLNLKVVTEI